MQDVNTVQLKPQKYNAGFFHFSMVLPNVLRCWMSFLTAETATEHTV